MRWRVIAIASVIEIAGSSFSLWGKSYLVLGILICVFTPIITALVVIRYFRLQCIESDQYLHKLCHTIRDEVADITSKRHGPVARAKVEKFQEQVANLIAAFFRERLHKKTINCAIRLAEDNDGKEEYVTRARSSGMDATRDLNSQPIPSDKGLALALMGKDTLGAFIVPDVREASSTGMWVHTKNDDSPDVRSVMAAPINRKEAEGRSMLGILYVTAPNSVFQPAHTIPLKAVADLLGMVYPLVIRGS